MNTESDTDTQGDRPIGHVTAPGGGRPSNLAELDSHYEELEGRFTIREAPELGALVVPTGNASTAVHRWFHLKEAFSQALLADVLKRVDLLSRRGDLRIVDPFAGSGTTLVSAAQLVCDGELSGAHLTGLEVHPFLHVLSSVKLAAFQADKLSINSAAALLQTSLKLAKQIRRERIEVPSLTTLANESYIPADHLNELLRLREAILKIEDRFASRLAKVCLAACIEPSTRLRRDGRALRFERDKVPVSPFGLFGERLDVMAHDLSNIQKGRQRPIGSVVLGDARSPRGAVRDGTADLVMFSPPYPNNIDYTEVYKLELWLLGMVRNQQEFRAQRLRTVRSHPSVKFADRYFFRDGPCREDVSSLLGPVLSSIPIGTRETRNRRRLVQGYVDDMLLSLRAAYRMLRPSGWLVYVVANSLHGNSDLPFPIAADLLIARCAQITGFDVESVEVARRPPRRSADSRWLRESVVFIRRP